MIFQSSEFIRLILIFIPQPLIGVLFYVLAFRVLKRERSLPLLTMVTFYLLIGSGFFLNMVYYIAFNFMSGWILYFLYYVVFFLLTFPIVCIPLFILTLLKTKEQFSHIRYAIYMLVFGFICIISLFLPDSITFSLTTGSPTYDIWLSVATMLNFTLLILIPTLYYSRKLYKSFSAPDLKKKLKPIIIGFTIILFSLYGTILFNSIDNLIFKSVWALFVIVSFILVGFLIYIGLGKNL